MTQTLHVVKNLNTLDPRQSRIPVPVTSSRDSRNGTLIMLNRQKHFRNPAFWMSLSSVPPSCVTARHTASTVFLFPPDERITTFRPSRLHENTGVESSDAGTEHDLYGSRDVHEFWREWCAARNCGLIVRHTEYRLHRL